MATIGRIEEFDGKDSWESYSERVEQFFEANVVEDKKKVAILLTCMGAQAYQDLKDMAAPNKPSSMKLKDINKLMSRRYDPKSTVILQRFRFRNRLQQEGEGIASYVASLRKLASKCSFQGFLEEALRDQIVCGLREESTQRKLLGTEDLDLEKTITIVQAREAAQRDFTEMKRSSNETHKVCDSMQRSQSKVICYCCGNPGHKKPDCPRSGQRCNYCHRHGHCEQMCLKKKNTKSESQFYKKNKQHQGGRKSQKTGYVDEDSYDEDANEETCTTEVYRVGSADDSIKVEMTIEGKNVVMEVDTGAKKSIMSEAEYSLLGPRKPVLQKTRSVLKTYSGEIIEPLGMIDAAVSYNGQHRTLPLIIAPGKTISLLGRDWLNEIKLDWPSLHSQWAEVHMVKQSVLSEFPELFKATGVIKDVKVSLNLDPTVPARFCKARPVPFSLRPQVEAELRRLENAGTIYPVKSSKWASPIVPVVKADGSVRICGDYKIGVNRALTTDVYPLPTPDDLFTLLAGGRFFSKLDLQNAYLQLPLSEESREVVTINTHKGLFTYNSLPFGIASAPAVFQRTLESIIGNIPGVAIYLDDILVCGRSKQEHDDRLRAVLGSLSKAGLRLKREKCEISSSCVTYLGHKVSEKGVEVLKDKVLDIAKLPVPQNKQELQSWIGMVTYYDKFLPHLSTELEPLHKLLRKDMKFSWKEDQDAAFNRCKKLLQTSPVLCHYDTTKPLILTVDSSAYGLGAVLSHQLEDGEHPIAYKSRKLNVAEKNYAQLDKEALAISFGLSKFHKYLFGRSFVIITDHKPLLGLLGENKRVPEMTSPRLQRFALRLSAYNYRLMHKPGKQISNADGLSRLPVGDEIEASEMPGEAIMSMEVVNGTPVSCDKIKSWTDKDPVLSKVREFVLTGRWPYTVPEEIKPYAYRKIELSIEEGILMWGARVIIPLRGRADVLNELHVGHPGVSRMKALARSYIWWPKCDADIEATVQKCSTCQQQRQMPASPPLHPWEYPERPWSRIHMDYAGPFLGNMFLVLVDAFSKWVEVHVVKKQTSASTISKCRQSFAIHGLPEVIVSDNGACFTSSEFKEFLKECGAKHVTSAPYHPATNGLAENAVKSFKRSIKKMHSSGSIKDTVSRYLLQQHITPHTTTGQTPAELMMQRRLRSRLQLIKPDLNATVRKKQRSQKLTFDKKTKSQFFTVDETVHCKNHSTQGDNWLEGTVVARSGPVSYMVELYDGRIVRRHASQLLKRDKQCVKTPMQDLNAEVSDEPPETPPYHSDTDVPNETTIHSPQPEAHSPGTETAPPDPPPSTPVYRRSSRSTKGIPPVRFGDN